MKEILSYWDISLGLIAIGFGVFKRYKLYIERQNSDKKLLKNSNDQKTSNSYAKLKNESLEDSLCYLVITIGIIFIYNRLNGNFPNIITLIKELSTY